MTFYSNCDTKQPLDIFLQELLCNQLLFPSLYSSCLTILIQIFNSDCYYTIEFKASEFNPILSGHFSTPILQASPWLSQLLLYVPTSDQKTVLQAYSFKSNGRDLCHKS